MAKVFVPLDFDLLVATLLGGCLIVDQVIKYFQITIDGRELMADLIILDMQVFNIILGMD